jgi:hypothetical protein
MQVCGRASSRREVSFILLILATVCMVSPALAATSAESAASNVAVTSIAIEPEVFMQEDIGTIRIGITNSGSESVAIYRAEILTSDIEVLNYQTYDSVGSIGPGNSMEFTFQIKPDTEDGMYFPMFYLDFTDAGSLRYPVALKVDDTPLTVSVTNSPETFSTGTKEKVTLSISNPRQNAVNSVTVTPGGEGILSTQSSIFIGTLDPDEEKTITFGITAGKDTTLAFDVSYRNGINQHTATLKIPVTVGTGGTAAEMVVNNVEVTQSGSTVTVSGDVTNAGLRDAKSVKVTVGSPATPVDPNPVYVVGALEPDDFSSFEVTCTVQGASTIPLVIEYRDEDGKVFERTVSISLNGQNQGASGSGASPPQGAVSSGNPRGGLMGFGSGINKIPVTEIVIILVACIAVAFAWRKGYLDSVVKKIRDRPKR